MMRQTLVQIIVVVLLTAWQGILYAEETGHLPLCQYLMGEFFKDKTDKFVGKYQPDDGKETVEVAYLPLRNVLTPADEPTSEPMAIFNSVLYDYLTVIAKESSFLKLSAAPDNPQIKNKSALIAQILVICDALIAPMEKIQRLEKLIEPKVEVIITGHYLEKPEDHAIKVRLIVVSMPQQRIENKLIDFQSDKFICGHNAQKVLCPEVYKQMVTTLNAIIFDEEFSKASPTASDVTLNETPANDNGNKTPQPTSCLDNENLGVLPFSRLASQQVQNQIGGYYDDRRLQLENELINTLKKKYFWLSL